MSYWLYDISTSSEGVIYDEWSAIEAGKPRMVDNLKIRTTNEVLA